MCSRKTYIPIFIAWIFLSTSAYAQVIDNDDDVYVDYNNLKLPETPNGASIGTYGDIQVNTSTGIPNITIPIYVLEVDGIQVPISLSYDATGIKVGDIGTAVGQNWKLNAGGGVFKTIQTKLDEENWLDGKGFVPESFYTIFDPENHSQQVQLRLYAENRDHNPDLFSYNFLGFSGKYVRNIDGTIVKDRQDPLLIFDQSSIDDINGNRYTFDELETSKNYHYTVSDISDIVSVDWEPQTTGWLLTEIVTKNNKAINFEYKEVELSYNHPNLSHTIELSKSCVTHPENKHITKYTTTTTYYDYSIQLIKKISTDGVEINFNYTTDTSLAPEFQEKLTSIVINDLITGDRKKFNLVHSIYPGDSRLRLDGIYEVDISDNPLPGYSFIYEAGSLPAKNSTAQDFFGYYNGKGGFTLVHNSVTAQNIFNDKGEKENFIAKAGDRSLGENFLKRGILKKMFYPTGGNTEFTYEPNKEGEKYCGGLRVKKITNWDTDGVTKLIEREYLYSNLVGHDPISIENDLQLTYKIDGESWIFSSSFVARPDIYSSGHFYKNVTIINKSVQNTDTFKEEHTYINYNGDTHFRNPFTNYEGLLKEKRIYKGTQLISVEDYEYDYFGDEYSFYWYILGDRICYGPWSFENTGYSEGLKINYTGNLTKLPILIATTDYLPTTGTQLHPVTTVKTIDYNEFLQPIEEIIDYRKKRVEDSNGNISFVINDGNAEVLTISYTYPADYSLSIPQGLPISKIIHSKNENKTIFGQYFVYDNKGNIHKTFHYNKGKKSNTFGSYVPSNYEEIVDFIFEDGNPVQVINQGGAPISYIWGYYGKQIVAKIENTLYSNIPSGLITDIKEKSINGTESQLLTSLNNLRSHSSLSGAMITTYTYKPLYGVRTITDPKADRITYHYDGFGRLSYVTDAQGKKLEQHEYHYESE